MEVTWAENAGGTPKQPKWLPAGNPNFDLGRTGPPPPTPCQVQCLANWIWWKTPVGGLTP